MHRLFLFFLLICSITCNAQYFDTLHIHYAIGEAVLQSKDKKTLDSLARNVGDRKLLIYSYADYLGSEKPNQHLSDDRAEQVKNYLVQQGVKPELVMECTGLGRIAGSGSPAGDPHNRRTDVFIRRSQPPAPAERLASPAATTEPAPELRLKRVELPEVQANVTPIDVGELKVGQAVRLENIGFYPGLDVVMRESYGELNNLYEVMNDNPSLKIRLEGHVCCCVYPDGFFEDTPTWGLSVARAKIIYDYLQKRGIAPERMEYAGFGRTKPIRDHEKTIEEGQVNRRVEIRILAK